MRAVLADFERRGITYPDTPEDRRMAQVVIDQTRQARAYASYLPSTTELPLAPILAALQREPGERGAAHWAATAGITERTLLRHCQQHLGMSFNDWRQRLRVVSALGMLDAGLPVQDVARRLGYSTPSAFIAMFQRLTGNRPTARGGAAATRRRHRRRTLRAIRRPWLAARPCEPRHPRVRCRHGRTRDNSA